MKYGHTYKRKKNKPYATSKHLQKGEAYCKIKGVKIKFLKAEMVCYADEVKTKLEEEEKLKVCAK